MSDHERIQERERGHLAKQVLDNPVYQSAWSEIAGRLREHMESPASSDEAVLAARNALVILNRVRGYVEKTMETGRMADMQLERSKNGKQ